jgi:hypothetical protein
MLINADRSGHADGVALPKVPLSRLTDPAYAVMPHYWIRAVDLDNKMEQNNTARWLLGWRDICRNTDQRTVIASLLPRAGVGDKFLLMLARAKSVACLYAALCSFPLDYVARQKLGGVSLKYFTMRQLPVVPPAVFLGPAPWDQSLALSDWIEKRVLELTYTALDLESFAKDCGYDGPPFVWNVDRRFSLRCELDAAFFYIYLGAPEDWQKEPAPLTALFPSPRSAVEYIMETFSLVKKNDEKQFGHYRTKEKILDIYDRMATAIAGGPPFGTLLDPPPADPSVAHPSEGAATGGG